MGLPHPDFTAMHVSIAGNQLETLHYRIQAQASIAPGHESGEARAGEPAPPLYAQHPAGAADTVQVTAWPAAWLAAVRALRERTLAEVEVQRTRFVTMTGRDWQIAALEFGEPLLLAGAPGPGPRIALVASVVLRGHAPTLH